MPQSDRESAARSTDDAYLAQSGADKRCIDVNDIGGRDLRLETGPARAA
ncbi:hypothetical protein ABID59_004427 [Bradyrhizobium sp. S3.3.6]